MDNELPYRIEIDRSVCMGSGVCVVYAAETFDIDDETKSVVQDAAGNPQAQIEAAVAGCPTGAITFVHTADG
jgi:ferredoxin